MRVEFDVFVADVRVAHHAITHEPERVATPEHIQRVSHDRTMQRSRVRNRISTQDMSRTMKVPSSTAGRARRMIIDSRIDDLLHRSVHDSARALGFDRPQHLVRAIFVKSEVDHVVFVAEIGREKGGECLVARDAFSESEGAAHEQPCVAFRVPLVTRVR